MMKSTSLLICLAWGAYAATVPTTVHPSWTKINLRPTLFQPQVSGLGFLSDGRLVLADWNSARNLVTNLVVPRVYQGRVYVLSGVQGDAPNVSIDTIARGLEDPMGMVVVNDTIYVSGGNTIVRLNRAGNTGPVTRVDTVFILPGTPESGTDSLRPQHGTQEYLNGLLYRNGKFYISPSSLDPSGSGNPQINPYRGTFLEVTPGNGTTNKKGSFRVVSIGLRAPSGLGFGPDGLPCVPDNQGEWLPNNKLICLQEGKFYGAKKSGGGTAAAYYTPWDNLTETPATVFGVEGDIANSPTAPLFIPSGLYAGQMLMGDMRWGGVQRYFLEKNSQGEYQGCVFVFTGGLEAGVFRMAWGPDGMLYLGMLGGKNDADGWPVGLSQSAWFGLQKLRYNGDTTFEMLAMRSRPAGMEIEFTKPVDATVARLASTYTIQTYYFVPTSAYGGSKTGTTTLTPGTIQISPDGRKVYLPLTGLVARTTAQPQRVVYIKLNGMKSATGASPWTTETWYTLNAFGTGNPFDPPARIDPAVLRSGLLNQLKCRLTGGDLIVQTPFRGSYQLRVRDLRGTLITSTAGIGSKAQTLSVKNAHGRFVVVEAVGDGVRLRRTIALP